ncbi:XdhC family protein [Berryella wangjianweii]|uniref:XdhC family protein n=1 Tax=Berryella wangjianweii TaxID=2734634 RepID=A0A6M8IZJ9_9ACTN|nr:XdhC family protein [Berryella wangjianweii]QKF07150.1 XdhC family protein [Berryella wangjianweii]
MDRHAIEGALEALRQGRAPQLTVKDVPAFAQGLAHLDEAALAAVCASLDARDIPTFERALRAIDEKELAWLGFKVVYDPAAAQANADNAVTKPYGAVGSANGDHAVFFCSDAKEVVCGRDYAPRDLFQMKDATRGPSMHTEQFEGLTWAGAPLFTPVRVWLLGASDVACHAARYAREVGFEVIVVDDEPLFLSAERFPHARRELLGAAGFGDLSALEARCDDYVCVLTRGHMHDPEGCVWALRAGARYVGMMGCAGKNERVRELVRDAGVSQADWERVKRPIGLSFGAKTPAELGMAIVAELIDVRYRQRYSAEARARHDASLGRAPERQAAGE